MTDRVHPSSATKPNANGGAPAAAAGGGGGGNPAKPKVYNPNRIPYRARTAVNPSHLQPRRFSCRRCFCLCCFWSILLLCILLLLAAILGAAFYVLYRPHHPVFSVSSLKISQFNLTTAASDGTTRLAATLNLTLSAKNPDAKMIYTYDPISLTAFSGVTVLANGTFPGFISNPNNITIIHSTLSMPTPQVLDSDSVSGLKSDLKRKNGLPIKILMDTMVLVKLEKMKSKKVGIRVTCEGIHAPIPKGRAPGLGTTSHARCTVDLRFTLWKFSSN
ncbi:PREDICTED: uncharacterized protein LOC109185027 [Ipomoea nil]|uniref:uncharacterized protein LOC109185027 n=1 Tax=Ipomoea nil TaxID=35883 RepID=UPI000900C57F|nr:PREDICTED: uncharacterized protein LOC109185027 [Ipomoea nil]